MMLRMVLLFFLGWVKFTVYSGDIANGTDIMRRFGVESRKVRKDTDGNFVYIISFLQYLRIKKTLSDKKIEYTVSEVKGLPKIFIALARRPGIALGVIFFMAVSIISGKTIWNIEISGNKNVSDTEIINLLGELGCTYGDDFTKIDFDRLHNDFLVKSEEVSWIAVNMTGTCAMVEVRELRRGEDGKTDSGVGANIVASEDAQVMLVKVEDGLGQVKGGDIVKKGDLLISGVVPLREGGVRLAYAKGEILAYVPRVIEAKIQFENTQKNYTGRKIEKKSLKIFKKSINLSLNYGIEYTSYDKIVENERVCLFGVIPLPVWVEKVVFKEYENTRRVLGNDAAVNAAMSEIRYETDELLETCEVIRITLLCDVSDTHLTLKQEMLCITDIAETLEFSAEENDGDDGLGERIINGTENNHSQ